MPRFYVDQPLSSGEQLDLPESVARHVQVLRLQPGAVITLFNGQGGEYEAVVRQMGKRNVAVEIGAHIPIERESPLKLTIVQAISASDRMDFTMQKSAELGVSAIQPVISEYCQQRYAGDRAEKRREHWRGVAIGACEQCGRTRVPEIRPILKFDDWLAADVQADLKLLLSPEGAVRHSALPDLARDAIVLIGPEGGFSLREEQAAIAAAFTPLILGPRIYRTETMAPVVAALLQSRYGDW